MANSILEVFDQEELDIIFEALEHRRRYYENKIPQQRTNAACGTVKSVVTLEKYIEQEERLRRILAKWVEETT
jgi:hypothetical protein